MIKNELIRQNPNPRQNGLLACFFSFEKSNNYKKTRKINFTSFHSSIDNSKKFSVCFYNKKLLILRDTVHFQHLLVRVFLSRS